MDLTRLSHDQRDRCRKALAEWRLRHADGWQWRYGATAPAQAPTGSDKRGAWAPHIPEEFACCQNVRPASPAHPHSYLHHFQTLRHIAHLYSVPEWVLRPYQARWRAYKAILYAEQARYLRDGKTHLALRYSVEYRTPLEEGKPARWVIIERTWDGERGIVASAPHTSEEHKRLSALARELEHKWRASEGWHKPVSAEVSA